MALVIWIWLLPLQLRETDKRADAFMRREIANRLAPDLARTLPRQIERGRWEAALEARTTQWIAANRALYEERRGELSEQLRDLLRYPGADGRSYVYLPGSDSYSWLRSARNFLRHGTTCDEVVGGVCRDTYTDAPVGAEMQYSRSLHIAAIVAVHRLFSLFDPRHPLPASAYWVPVIVVALGVIPAFFLGRRLAGDLAGLFAAALTATPSVLLSRGIGADNDAWNTVLPLFVVWAVVEALAAPRRPRRLLWATVAGFFAALHAATWAGWLFTPMAAVAGLGAAGLMHALRHGVRQGTIRLWHSRPARHAVEVAAVFVVASALLAVLIGNPGAFSRLASGGWRGVAAAVGIGRSAAPAATGAAEGSATGSGTGSADWKPGWPSMFSTVEELKTPTLGRMVEALGGMLVFAAAFLGPTFLLLPRRRWRPVHWLVLLVGAAAVAWVASRAELGRTAFLAGLVVPPLLAALAYIFDRSPRPGAARRSAAVLLLAWCGAGAWWGVDAIRFLLLMAPPFGVAAAAAGGCLCAWMRGVIAPARATPYRFVGAALFGGMALLLIPPLRLAVSVAEADIPAMNDAWWQALENIRDHTPADALVNTWWDYGYWVKYVAERPVTADGASLQIRVHPWMARALLSGSERESAGLLRMLDCGSDARPLPEGRRGAYARAVAAVGDEVMAYAVVADLAKLSKDEARSYLQRRGFTAAQQDAVLQSTHCRPRPAYLVISDEQLQSPDILIRLGSWDMRDEWLAQSGGGSGMETLSRLMRRLRYTQPEAFAEFAASAERRGIGTLPEIRPLTPSGARLSSWISCRAAAGGQRVVCPIGQSIGAEASMLDAFVFNPGAPELGQLLVRRRTGEELAARAEPATAASVVVAADELRQASLPEPDHPEIGVLIDLANQRIAIGLPALIRSTLVQLLYLDGRYCRYFHKIDERSAAGTRVQTWQIDWEALE